MPDADHPESPPEITQQDLANARQLQEFERRELTARAGVLESSPAQIVTGITICCGRCSRPMGAAGCEPCRLQDEANQRAFIGRPPGDGPGQRCAW